MTARAAARVLLVLGIAFFLLFTIGETAGGDVTGLQHLPPALFLAGVLWWSWRQPRAAGIALLVLAVPLAVAYVALLVVRDLPLTWALVVAFPPVLTGALLVRAGRSRT